MSTFYRGIKETIPSLFRGIYLEGNSVANPTPELIPFFIQIFVKSLHLTGRGGAALSVAASGTFLWSIMWVVGGGGGG